MSVSAKKPKPKFKVGDRVMVRNYWQHNEEVEVEGVVRRVYPNTQRSVYLIDYHEIGSYHYESDVRLADDFAQWAQDVRAKHKRKKRKKVSKKWG